MELPDLGKHCSESTCNKLDFLPIKCDACNKIFCDQHFSYIKHSCPNAYMKNNQVPCCPLCNKLIIVRYNQTPDQVVSEHIDNDCQSDPAKDRRKVFVNKCSLKGCKSKELIPFICNECKLNYCLKHRHPIDHKCKDKLKRKKPANINYVNNIHGHMSEDEALAHALALSMQEEADSAIARQLQTSESRSQTTVGGSRNRDKCNIS